MSIRPIYISNFGVVFHFLLLILVTCTYIHCYLIKIFLVLPTSILNSDSIYCSKILIIIRFYQLHWECIWHTDPQSFLETCFVFFCCLQQILWISWNDQRQSWFSFRPRKFPRFVYMRRIIIFWLLWK